MKTTNTFSVQFITRTGKANKEEAIIYARVNVNSKRTEISIKRSIHPSQWNASSQSVKGTKEQARQINAHIDEVRYKLMECYRQLQSENKVINATAIKNLFLGEERKANTLGALIGYHNTNMKTMLEKGTLKNYHTTERYLKLFLKHRHKTDDIYLTDLNYQFITEFEFFLRRYKPLSTSNPLTNNGIMKHLERLKKMVTLAVKME